MITSLKLSNWKSHYSTYLKFSKGVNALLGIIGSGKSSVMDAMCFALFGTFPALNQKKLKLDDVLRNRPSPTREAKVEIEFLHGQDVYKVSRSIVLGKGTGTCELRKNTTLVESPSPQKVTEHIESLLKLDYEIFSRAVYAEQNQLDYFLSIPSGQRRAKIDSLLKIDRFEEARKKASAISGRISDKISEKIQSISEFITAEDEQIFSSLKTEVLSIEKEAARLEKELEKISSEKKEVHEKVRRLETNEKKMQFLEKEEAVFEGQSLQIREHIFAIEYELSAYNNEKLKKELDVFESKIKSLDSEIEKLAKLKSEKLALEHEISQIKADLKKINADLESLKNSLAEKEESFAEKYSAIEEEHGSFPQLEKELEKIPLKKIELEKKISSNETQQKYSEHVLKELKTGKRCPTCREELKTASKEKLLEEHAKLLEAEGLRLEALKKELSESENREKELSKIIESVKKLQNSLKEEKRAAQGLMDSYAKRGSELCAREKAAREKLSEASALIKEIEKKNPVSEKEKLEKNVKVLAEIKKGLEYKEKLSAIEEKLKKIRSEKIELEFYIEQLLPSKKEYEEFSAKESTITATLSGIRQLLSEKNKRVQEFEKKKTLLEQYKKEVEWLEKAKSTLQVFENALLKTQESLRVEFIVVVNQVMLELWNTLYPYKDIDAVRLFAFENNYVLQVRNSSGWVDVEGIASGGERSLACLALRIAFSLALAPNLRWLVLDEPTHNLDDKSIEELGATLRERLPSLIEQVFLITHEDKLESAVTGYLYKLERNKEVDEPTRVNMIASPEVEV